MPCSPCAEALELFFLKAQALAAKNIPGFIHCVKPWWRDIFSGRRACCSWWSLQWEIGPDSRPTKLGYLVNSSSRCISRFPELIGTDSPISNHFQHQYLPQFRNLMETDIIFRPLLTMTSGLFNLTERDSGRPLGYRRDILQKGYIIHEGCAFGLYTSSKSSCLSFTFEILT